MLDSKVCLMVEIPEVLHGSVQRFLDARPDWDQERVMQAAVSLFLLQMPETSDRVAASQIYVKSMVSGV
jgi:hypothetical protein